MKVFLTGATGFIGSRLCQKLSLAHEVVALCRSESADDALPEKVEAVRGDLEDAEHLRSLVAAARPEAVVHLAARIASTRDDTALARVNTQGTAALIEAAVGAGVHRFLFASTVVTGDAGGALLAYLHSVASNLVSAGVRLIPLGQTEGQAVIAALETTVIDTATRAQTVSLDEVGTTTPMVDWSSMAHETQYTRLFRS